MPSGPAMTQPGEARPALMADPTTFVTVRPDGQGLAARDGVFDSAHPFNHDSAWCLEQAGFVPEIEHDLESRFAISNGNLGMRASLPAQTDASRPRLFLSGLFGMPAQEPRTPFLIPLPN